MPVIKIVKVYCPKTGNNYCIEVSQINGALKAVNFVDIDKSTATSLTSEINLSELYSNISLLPCSNCHGRKISGCDCAKKSQFCGNGKYYFQCLYCRELTTETSMVGNGKIYVSSAKYDNVGEVLNSMNIKYSAFNNNYDSQIIFLNCGTNDSVDIAKLRKYVNDGGCLYASDQTDTIISKTFPDVFSFGGHRGHSCRILTEVIDQELQRYVGQTVEIEFDLGSWAILDSSKGKTILRASQGNAYSGKPIMVHAVYGRGNIFYTCFHNHKQASEKEKALLQLLLLKQMSVNSKTTVEQMGSLLGINLVSLRERFKS